MWTGLGLVYVVWGSTYLAIAYVVQTLPPLLSASARFAVAAVVLAGYVAVRRGPSALRASRRQAGAACVVGLLLLLGGNGGVALAEDASLPSGLVALLIAAVPLWVVLMRLADRDRPTARTLVGVGVGFAGVAVLLLPGARPQGVPLGPAAVVVGASLLWSAGSYAASRLPLPRDALTASAIEMAAGAVGLGMAGVLRGERLSAAGSVSTASLLALLYLVVFGSLVAFTAYGWLLSVAPVSQVATYAYVNPVVAVGLGALLLAERVSVTTLVGGALTVAAVAVVVGEEGRRRPDQPVELPADAPGTSGPVPARFSP